MQNLVDVTLPIPATMLYDRVTNEFFPLRDRQVRLKIDAWQARAFEVIG